MTTQDEIEKQIDEILLGGGGHTWQRRQIMKLLAAHDKEIVRQAEIRALKTARHDVEFAERWTLTKHEILANMDERINTLDQQLYLTNEEEKDEIS